MYCINDEKRQKASAQILAFGIVSLVCALTHFPIVGFIFGLIALIRASRYRKTYGGYDTPVRTGKGLSIAGVILTSIPVAILALIVLLIVLYILIIVIWVILSAVFAIMAM